jgi:hypothetical protein
MLSLEHVFHGGSPPYTREALSHEEECVPRVSSIHAAGAPHEIGSLAIALWRRTPRPRAPPMPCMLTLQSLLVANPEPSYMKKAARSSGTPSKSRAISTCRGPSTPPKPSGSPLRSTPASPRAARRCCRLVAPGDKVICMRPCIFHG